MARDDSYLLKFSLALVIFGAAIAVRVGAPSESFKLLFVGAGAALLLPRALRLGLILPGSIRLALLVWLLGFVLSGVFALDSYQALMGSFERSQGAMSMLFCVTLALARVPITTLTSIVAVACGMVSLWACAQATGLEAWLIGALQWQHTQGFANRVFAGFGNPVNLGNWLCIALVFLMARSRHAEPSNRFRKLYLMVCGLGALALCLTASRAAFIATVFGGVCIFWPSFSRTARIGVLSLLFSLTVLLSALPGRSASLQARFELWQSVVVQDQANILDSFGRADPHPSLRFWLGYGQDMQSVPLAAALAQQDGQIADRAHNVLLDLWLCTGVWGVLSSLILLFLVWRSGLSTPGVIPVTLAACVVWSMSFGLSADKSLLALIIGALWRAAPALPDCRPISSLLSAAALLFCWITYRPLPYSAAASDYVSWRKPEQAIADFRLGQTLYLNDPALAVHAFERAQEHNPWRPDIARARQQAMRLRDSNNDH